jgi:hypothetical protein
MLSYEVKRTSRAEPEEISIARKLLSKYIPAAMNTHATTVELLDVMFSMWPVSYQISNL